LTLFVGLSDNPPKITIGLPTWSRQQPNGQRVEDKIKYAEEILSLYAPEKLATAHKNK